MSADQKPFEGDRYERLSQATDILAADENMIAAELPYNAEGLRCFVGGIIADKLLDGLTEDDANWVGMLVVLDFTRGLSRMGWRVGNMLSEKPDVDHPCDSEAAVIRAYVQILHYLLGAFVEAGL
ncbi:hypothetical protein [Mycolicibacterium sp. D5.8-2]|uniref:hypothetical protein n=1 Tax=Mycolicibacterium sp. D5.8-2 TaxID=3085903 RepID=UPI00298BE129|nr:hypothetical protein [Mycolicibacterium sp. D5.8-2]MDW5613240.1 hypothetical protein [Mycolicibacterium sp. D5.8-2]